MNIFQGRNEKNNFEIIGIRRNKAKYVTTERKFLIPEFADFFGIEEF